MAGDFGTAQVLEVQLSREHKRTMLIAAALQGILSSPNIDPEKATVLVICERARDIGETALEVMDSTAEVVER